MVYPNPQIYHHLKAIFVHVPKTAGTAIERALTSNTTDIVGGHTTALGYRLKFPEQFRDYFKFAVVRHPLDRFLSAYFYLRQHPLHPALNNGIIHECESLTQFVGRILESPNILARIVHFLPQHKFLCDEEGAILVDAVYQFEHLTQAWADLSSRLGLNGAKLLKRNESKREHWKTYWTDGLQQVMERVYNRDYEVFGYDVCVRRSTD